MTNLESPDETMRRRTRFRHRVRRIALALVGVFVVFALGRASTLSVDWAWWDSWLKSPGFGGLAAVFAAVIAFFAARLASRTSREQAEKDRTQRTVTERKSQWWARAQWALDLLKERETAIREMGLRVLEALGKSEWAGEHENDIIEAATKDALDARPEPIGIVALRLAGDDDPATRKGGVEMLASMISSGEAAALGEDFVARATAAVDAWIVENSPPAETADDERE